MHRRNFMKMVGGLAVLPALPSALAASPASIMADFISSGLSDVEACSREALAIQSTLKRLKKANIPSTGKFVLVNIPAGNLVAYRDGVPEMEMRAIVGTPDNKTPEAESRISSVRVNPTWTAPDSIARRLKYREKVVSDMNFFMENEFEFRDQSGSLLTPEQAQAHPNKIARFVQAAGRYNILGEYRFNIGSSESIYLHDTRDRENFYDGGDITRSAGCVRVEKPVELANWLLPGSEDYIQEQKRSGSTKDITVKDRVAVSLAYYTAWPDAEGVIVIYDDIYNLDMKSC